MSMKTFSCVGHVDGDFSRMCGGHVDHVDEDILCVGHVGNFGDYCCAVVIPS